MKCLYKEQNLQRGDIILCKGKERIFLAYIEGTYSPYICVDHGHEGNFNNNELFLTWNYPESQVRAKPKEWYEQIPEGGIICWVSDDNKDERLLLDVISEYRPKEELFFFSETNHVVWKYATPVKPEECWQGN